LQDALHIPISLGSISAIESEASDSLAESHAEAGEALCAAASKNVDETGWKQQGAKRWLWAAATTTIAFYVIHRRRGTDGFRALFKKIRGFFTTDRWHVYASVSTKRRQICWAHLKRDFLRMEQKKGKAGPIGKEAGIITSHVFFLWKDFKAGAIDRQALKACLRSLKTELRELLEQGVTLDQKGVSKFCQNLLDLEPALWNFASYEGIEPNNNHAERVIRPAVLWRKRSFGADSDRGCRYVERILTAAQSCRLQNRRIYDFLLESITAHRTGSLLPSLVRS
jgi:transposase